MDDYRDLDHAGRDPSNRADTTPPGGGPRIPASLPLAPPEYLVDGTPTTRAEIVADPYMSARDRECVLDLSPGESCDLGGCVVERVS
jgi:hypothetical protein